MTKVNDKEHIQALVDKKKVIISEDSIRSDLRLVDSEGIACLLNEAIFEGLAHMGRKQMKEAETSLDESKDEDHVPTPSSDPLSSGRRVKSPLDKDSLGAQEDASKQERMIEEINQNAEIALDVGAQGRKNDDEIFAVDDLAGEEVVMDSDAKPITTVKDSAALTTDVTKDEITMAQALAALKSVKPTIPTVATKVTTVVPTSRAKVIVFHVQKQSQISTISSSKDKEKAKMIKPEVPLKKKEQIRIDEEYARKLQAKEQEAARLNKMKKLTILGITYKP
nr:hypothetical protein [Tanacetum cinerariifolium]